MIDKLQDIIARYEELGMMIAQNDIIANTNLWRELTKEHAQLMPIATIATEYARMLRELEQAQQLQHSADAEIAELAGLEVEDLKQRIDACEQDIRIMLLPKDPNDDKNVLIEIRAGTGGEEAALFGMDLMRMYLRYAERQNWKVEVAYANETDLGGLKEAALMINGKNAYSRLKFESGVHRVQRIPSTESGGRIHTSAATVAVMPEVDEIAVEINPNDLRIDTYRSGGAGGQHVNKTESAIRITHLPTGLVVTCQDEKSQIKNKEKAMRVLRARLYDLFNTQQQNEQAENRRSQVGSGDRSERIRTYNFPQGRITDHRINLTLYSLANFIEGDLDAVLDALHIADQTEKLKAV